VTRRLTGIVAAVAGAALAAGLAACGGPTTHERPADEAKGTAYVAIGDSYTAAPGIARADAKDGCYRSRNSYPYLVARHQGLTLADRSCSNAQTADVTRRQLTLTRHTVPPQTRGLGPATRLVTFGIGANDFGLISLVKNTCITIREQEGGARPCTDYYASSGLSLDAVVRQLRQRLETLFVSVRGLAPNARLMVIGYPTIVPAAGTCALLPLAHGDYAFARRIMAGLNSAEREAAQTAGATYVDTTAVTRGHDICSAHPWIAGAKLLRGKKGAPWHPYAEEQAAVARLIEAELD